MACGAMHPSMGGALAVVSPSALGIPGAPDASLSVPMPFASRIVLFEDAHVAGTTHVKDIDSLVAGIREGQELSLVRDAGNLHDEWAIRVLVAGRRIGYVPADRNEVLARLMDGGKHLGATVTAKEKLGNWNKIHMEVYLDD